MTRGPAVRARGRLRLRLALGLATIAASGAASVSISVLWLTSRTLERSVEHEARQQVLRVAPVLEAAGGGLRASLQRAERRLRGGEPALAARLVAGGPAAVEAARQLAGAVGLDTLLVLGERGAVVSSSPRPERAGLAEPSMTRLPDDGWVLGRLDEHDGGGLALLARREVLLGTRRLDLVSWQQLDERLLAAAAPGRPAMLFALREGKAMPLATAGPTPFSPGKLTALAVDGAVPGEVFVDARDGSRWSIARAELAAGDGDPLGAVVVGIDRSAIDAALRDLQVVLLIVGTGFTVPAALGGLWIAERVTRPVGRLIDAVDAIAAGRADYAFESGDRADELQHLAQAFSRLQRSLERQQHRSAAAERVAAWREVARRVAHEVKNPLVPIRLTVQNLKRAREKDPRLFDSMFDEGANTVLDEVERLSRLVGEFAEFARLPAPDLRPADLDALIDRALELYASERELSVVRNRGDLPPVRLDADQVARVMHNVVGNAVDAMRDLPADRRILEVGVVREGEMVRIEVADRGPGVDDETRRRMFQPYYTNKPHGTGLGLAICERIVTDHGGWIAAEARQDGGTRIVIVLPLGGTPVPPEQRQQEATG